MENANTRKDNDANLSANNDSINHRNGGPQIQSLQDLTQSEIHPKAGQHRYMVSPPEDDKEHPVTLVTCTTTVGYLHVSCCFILWACLHVCLLRYSVHLRMLILMISSSICYTI